MNQTLIVALNQAYDGHDLTMPSSLAALDANHAAPNTSCYACHLTLDPMRQYFRQAMTVYYHEQTDQNQKAIPAAYAQNETTAIGSGLADLAQRLAQSPDFAKGWVVKACTWANNGPRAIDDPEVLRIANNFRANNYDFLTMLKEVLVSDLTTYRASTKTATAFGPKLSIIRRKQLCNLAAKRLNLTDPCHLDVVGTPSNLTGFPTVMQLYPSNGFSRNSTSPLMVTSPSLLVRMSLEFACSWLAYNLVDASSTMLFKSTDPNRAIDNLLTSFMGVPEAQKSAIEGVLRNHYQSALDSNVTAKSAMQSIFTLACTSPYVAMTGVF